MKKLVVGLGNPEAKYSKNRHNIGFIFLDSIVSGFKLSKKLNAEVVEKDNIVYLKPQTFMNSSGESIRKAMAKYQIPVENIIIIFDDVNLGFKTLRYRDKGSAGGHNGIKSVIAETGTSDFKRIKVGIGPNTEPDLYDFVLSDFTQEEFDYINQTLLKEINELLKEKL